MQLKFFLLINLILFSFVMGNAQTSPYAKRVYPVITDPTSCSENQIFYNMVSNKLLVCVATNTIAEVLTGTGTGITGSGANTRVPFFTSASVLSSDSNFTFNSTTDILTTTGFAGNLTGNVTGTASGNEVPLTFSAPIIRTVNTISLANTAVTPGSYTNTNLTIDAQGRITLAANGSSGGATTALDNLASVNINSALLAQTGIDLGSTTKPFRDLFLFGAGTYGTNYFRFTGTPTSTRIVTFPDLANYTLAQITNGQTFNGIQIFTSPPQLGSTDQTVDLGTTSIRPRYVYVGTGLCVSCATAAAGESRFYTSTNGTNISGGVIAHGSGVVVAWSAGDVFGVAVDIGLRRNGIGILEVDNGTLGTFRDLKLRTINATTDYQTNGNVLYKSGTPGIAGNGTLNTNSKDSAGKITTTGTGASTIVLTFSSSFANAPACYVTNETTANLVRPVTTINNLTINATIVTGDTLSYGCLGY